MKLEREENMARDIGILVIHGMGRQERDFHEGIQADVNGKLGRSSRRRIAWQPVYWADILETRQEQYLTRARREADLDYISLRRFMVSSIGDAAAYRRIGKPTEGTYGKIHARVRDAKKELDGRLAEPGSPFMILAHSLGGHIISNYIWDIQKSDPASREFRGLEALITFGCNIPLFTFALSKVEPVQLNGAIWENYYDPDDVLAYPIAPTRGYRRAGVVDKAINVGGLFSSWNPLSHSKYWTDDSLTRPIAEHVQRILKKKDD